MRSSIDDRTAKARIRDAAMECFAADGIDSTSLRTIAAAAGVSAGLVIHHFGSKDALRIACDEHVAARIREQKASAMAQGAGVDPLAALRSAAGGPPLLRYLARTIVDGSSHVDDLVDELVNDAVGYMETGVAAGLLTPSDIPRRRAALLTLWSLGGVVLHKHMERLLGVDITADFSRDPESAAAYVLPALDVLGGVVTDVTKNLWTEAFADASDDAKETA
ncbi:MAG TPA: TetR family transcriptional regulator [Acidimicrobiia bacterium]|nr:TetR family transcriptional regulator [Acidimicrobiia bacterium]